MTKLARLSARWIGNHGFSIGIEDVTPSDNLKREKASLITTAYAECDKLLDDFKHGRD
jgi:DNA-directed RNA polymerase III subunit RPC1